MSLLTEKLERRDVLTDLEKAAISDLLDPPREVKALSDIVAEHSRPDHSTLLLGGFAGRYVTLADGRRQITQISVAGDFVDLHSLLMKQMDHGVVALTDVTVANASHRGLRAITERHPHLTRVLWLDTIVDAAIHRQWIAAMGRRTGLAQLAHLLAELCLRLEVVGLARERTFELPLSQAVLGDALGLSAVHVSRLVGDLRESGLVQWVHPTVKILDWDGLVRIAEFDPTYLRLHSEPV
ncbi:Crp/Fnr family transcriptional regulator [Brevundimonas goettingensis]|nr:Crp/Fnr family transcriptional regulator [Brevundimonas goettingensis]